jgi:uncharacterized protein YjiK
MAQARKIVARVTSCLMCMGLAIAIAAELPVVVTRGLWVLLQDEQPAPTDDFQRGLQTSGLAWDGTLLWSVGDQRASYPGYLYAIDPQSGRLVRPPIPLAASEPSIQARLDAWRRLDLEDIAILSVAERRFVAVLEDKATAALVLHLNEQSDAAVVTAVWVFHFPLGEAPVPYRRDPNYRLEGIAVDHKERRGYVGFERDLHGLPNLYQFDLDSAPLAGIATVQLEPLHFTAWDKLCGKSGALLNVNGLQFVRTPSGDPRLFVLCRDRELFFVMDPHSGRLIEQVELGLRSPEGEPIEWPSPEGIAVDSKRRLVYIISDPDSTDGNYRLRGTPTATRQFAQFVPLLFQFKVPDELLR